MKFIKLLFLLLFLSCNKEKDLNIVTTQHSSSEYNVPENTSRFKPGDVVYIKPDSLKVVLTRYDEEQGWLGVWRDSSYNEFRVFYTEYEIY